ncbi:MAG TPA: TlyA family RNA methyltransferase [Candidatus Tectomicrobia bacterium]|nr:TlyA family RNA methyltransferase [Candidatus Tectomicrobia bacterium]
MTATGLRLDRWLVANGYVATRSRARWLIECGQVWVRGQPCRKPAFVVSASCQIELRGAGLPYVGRGGLKLERALQTFGIDVSGLVVFDIGASTGGFTDCLLQQGAERVYALDVGIGQLALKLRRDPRVIALEGRNVRTFQATELLETVGLVTVDVSFISLSLVLPLIPPFLQSCARVVALVKPQFEAGMEHIGRGGIVRGRSGRELALRRVIYSAEATGFHVLQAVDAPGLHAHGNQEIFIDLGWGVQRAITVAEQRHPSVLHAPTLSLKAPSGIDVAERG